MSGDDVGRVVSTETVQQHGVELTQVYWTGDTQHRDRVTLGPWSRQYCQQRARALNRRDPECNAITVTRWVTTTTRDWIELP